MPEPCRCLLDILRLDRPGVRAVCDRHRLFGMKQRDGTVIASHEPFKQRVYAEPASEEQLAADRRYRLNAIRVR